MEIVWKIVATLALVAINGFFVAAEFASVGARTSRLETAAEDSLLARMALQIKRRLDLYLSSCQLGVTLASLGLGAVTAPLIAALLDPLLGRLHVPGADIFAIGFTIAMGISTSLHIVIGEQAPKNWAIRFSDRILPLVAPLLVAFTYIFYPDHLAAQLGHTRRAAPHRRQRPGQARRHGGLAAHRRGTAALLAQAVAAGHHSQGARLDPRQRL